MSIARFKLAVCAMLAIAAVSRAQVVSGSASQQPPAPAAGLLEDAERRIGPLKVKGQSFTIVLHEKRVRGKAERGFEQEETVARMEILDTAARVLYERAFPFAVDDGHFIETNEVEVQVLEGPQNSGLLITYSVLPSTPLGGESWQVFGFFDGKLVPFSLPISVEGNLRNGEPSDAVVKTSVEPKLLGDVLHFRLWTSNVFVVAPVLVDWLQAKVRPGWRCTKLTSRGPLPVCRFPVEASRTPIQDDMTFVRLLPEEFEPDASAQHVVVKKTSKVEILEAAGVLNWEESPDGINMGVGEDLWLRVRIDGKEGWIHTQEDFSAIGLPQAG